MAGFTLTRPDLFPDDTEVGAYPKTNWSAPGEPSGEPVGAAAETQEVEDGTATFVDLDQDVGYWLVGEVDDDVFRYVSVIAGADTTEAESFLHWADTDTDGTLAANSDEKLPTQKAVKTAIAAVLGSSDAVVYKGVVDCSGNPNYPAADAGHLYRVSVAGKIGGAAGTVVEVGDTLLCNTDGAAAGTQAAVGAKWNVIQVNLDGAVIGPAAATDGRVAVFDGATGKLLKDGAVLLSALALAADLSVVAANTQTVDYTLALADAGKCIEVNSAESKAVTIPANGTIAFPVGTVIELGRIGAGAVEVKAAEGVTIRSPGGLVKLAAQYSTVSLRKRATNEWVLSGDLV